MLSLGLGTYFFIIAVIKDINGLLQNIDNCAKLKRKNQTHVLKKLFEFIQFHSDVKQLNNNSHFKLFVQFLNFNILFQFPFNVFSAMKHFSEVYQLVFACLFAWSLVTICGAMLMIQTELVQYSIY